ncbi:transcriptional regulator GutM [Oceanobacillus chungangensis]|uniref:Transcriptional regulator n=1 Tax=Oceanobacillus chungangensis TaxID=1229152 RepID=A0A3D8PX28_9BACI|nr:transcriptional regulator GutM [Oceanobacillus chungangensis]RDW20686.1 hypothetical protein CWR45_05520 [Oceanobacillus chungangensis]
MGTFIIIFASLWALQFFLTQLQVRHYRSNIKAFISRKSGYLGTGYYKKFFGAGAVVLLVCDDELEIIEAKIMKGLTVFSRFKDKKELIGLSLSESKESEFLNKREKNALKGSIEMIKKEFNKGKGNELWIS